MSDDNDPLSAALAPVDSLLEKGKHPAHQLHQQWVQAGKSPEHLSPLLDHFRPDIQREAVRISGGAKMVNPVAVQGKLTALALKAFETWDPDKGAALRTHVINSFKPARRFVGQAQNVARIPEEDALRIGDLQRATAHLSDQFGRAPTLKELSEETGLPERRVKRIQSRQVSDIPTGAFEVDAVGTNTARDLEIQPLIRERLNEHDRKVFDLIYRSDGQPALGTGQIAKKLGLRDYQVSEAKGRIIKVWKDHR